MRKLGSFMFYSIFHDFQTGVRPTHYLIVAVGHALLVVAGGLIVGIDDGVGGNAVGVVRLSPGVDGVDVCKQ
jgi:hypothetical protein